MLPHDLPRWFTAAYYFRQWKRAGIWEQVNAALRRELRVQMGREEEPSAAILDSQSIKTSSVRGDERGYDGGKKVSCPGGTTSGMKEDILRRKGPGRGRPIQ